MNSKSKSVQIKMTIPKTVNIKWVPFKPSVAMSEAYFGQDKNASNARIRINSFYSTLHF